MLVVESKIEGLCKLEIRIDLNFATLTENDSYGR